MVLGIGFKFEVSGIFVVWVWSFLNWGNGVLVYFNFLWLWFVSLIFFLI